jgi:DNA-binding transcriptional regulator YdaS (Cro superfamily)
MKKMRYQRDDKGLRAALDAVPASVIAQHFGISLPAVSMWTRVPANRVLGVEKLSGVSRYELRPDIFGDGSDMKRGLCVSHTIEQKGAA